MAAAIVPIAVQVIPLIPSIVDAIVGLVHKRAPMAEVQLGAGTGPMKFGDVYGFVIDALQKAATAGQIPKELPSDESIKLIIQAAVTSLKLQGALGQPPAVIVPIISQPAPATTITPIVLSAGQTLVISVV